MASGIPDSKAGEAAAPTVRTDSLGEDTQLIHHVRGGVGLTAGGAGPWEAPRGRRSDTQSVSRFFCSTSRRESCRLETVWGDFLSKSAMVVSLTESSRPVLRARAGLPGPADARGQGVRSGSHHARTPGRAGRGCGAHTWSSHRTPAFSRLANRTLANGASSVSGILPRTEHKASRLRTHPKVDKGTTSFCVKH